jgi:hypothetical protein
VLIIAATSLCISCFLYLRAMISELETCNPNDICHLIQLLLLESASKKEGLRRDSDDVSGHTRVYPKVSGLSR